MATNKFFKPGQSEYQSQYVPTKIPFQLMQQNLNRKDAEIDNAYAQAEGLTNTKATGLKDLGVTASNNNYYNGVLQEFGERAAEDYNRSASKKKELDEYVSGLLDDDFIMKTATGEIKNAFVKGNEKFKELASINSVNDARTAWRKEAEAVIQKNSDAVTSSPWWLTGYNEELKKMAAKGNENYVPTALPVIGESMDRSNQLILQVDRLKDNSRKGEDMNVGEAYKKWSSRSGRTAGEYEKFAMSILDNKNSAIRRNVDAQVNAHIQAGKHTEYGMTEDEFRKYATDFEIDNLIESARKLEHEAVASGTTGKAGGEIDAENAAEVQTILDAAYEEKGSKFISIGGAKEKVTKLNIFNKNLENEIGNMIDGVLTQNEQGKFVPVTLEMFRGAGREQLSAWGLTNIGGANIEDKQRDYNDSYNETALLNAQIKYNDNIARNDQHSGFSNTEENVLKSMNYIKSNPAEAAQLLDFISSGGNLESRAGSDPRYAALLDLKTNNKSFYENLIEDHNNGGLDRAMKIESVDGNTFTTTTKPSGMLSSSTTSYVEEKAQKFFDSIGGVPQGVDIKNQASVDKWVRDNKGTNNVIIAYAEAGYKRDSYENELASSTMSYQAGIVTAPGQVISMSDNELNIFNATSNTGDIHLLDEHNRRDSKTQTDVLALKNKALADMAADKGTANMLRLTRDTWQLTGTATMAEVYGNNEQQLIEQYEKSGGGDWDDLDVAAKNVFMNTPTSFTMSVENSSSTFMAEIDNKVTASNIAKAKDYNLTDDDVFTETYNRNASQIKQLENSLGSVAHVSEGKEGESYTSYFQKPIQIIVPLYVNGEGKKGNMAYTVTRIDPAVNKNKTNATDNNKLSYTFSVTDGYGDSYKLSGTTTNDIISQLTRVED